MVCNSFFKNTLLFSLVVLVGCNSAKSQSSGTSQKPQAIKESQTISHKPQNATVRFKTGAEDYNTYLPILKGKNIGVVANQTSIVAWLPNPKDKAAYDTGKPTDTLHLVDFLIKAKINVKKIYAPEHGFRGTADAGELIKDGKDTKTGLPIISLYGNNKKPKPEQLAGIDVLVFDLQDVGARFYTYISSLHYIMEACAENNIKLIILDRPNPNGSIIDGPTLEKEHTSFVGMHEIPAMHGMTIGEYAKMINGQKWLKNGVQCEFSVVPCVSYTRDMLYSLPVKPSPNLPNDQSINLYASLCFFEGTNVSLGRGTNKQFQIYGSPDLPNTGFSFTPMPNEGAKEPPLKGILCYGEDLSKVPKVKRLELKWLMKAYAETKDKSKFFIPFFTKLAGTKTLQQHIEAGKSETEIRKSWEPGLAKFRAMRRQYLIYPE